ATATRTLPIRTTPADTRTPTPTRNATGTASPTSTGPPSTPGGTCAGDCNGDGTVPIAELIQVLNVVFGELPLAQCPAADVDGDATLTIGDVIAAVRSALGGCP
ncbi:MAG: hypothetical protein U0802_26220, partial [Candidatus Binatia bacterium]